MSLVDEVNVRARRSVKRVALRAGLEIGRHRPGNPDSRRARLMHQAGIDLVIDVGANVGQYVDHLRSSGYRGEIVSFEPERSAFATLSAAAAVDPWWSVHQTAVGAEAGEAELLVPQWSHSSSLLPATERTVTTQPEMRPRSTQTVPVAALDSLLDGKLAGRQALLKMDVQGSEGAVLDGGIATLAAARLLEVEISFRPLYDGQAEAHVMLARLRSAGLRVIALEPGYVDPATGHLLEADVLLGRD